MPRIPLVTGAYGAQSKTADAQRCVNLFPEKNPEDSAMPFTLYPRPGLGPLSVPPVAGHGRALYATTDGACYAVIDQAVYYIDPNFSFTQIGSLITDATTPVSIVDDGNAAIIVDNSINGYQILLSSRAFSQIIDPNFVGSTRADFIDSFIVLNVPGTNRWYSTQSSIITPFNALFVGVKTAWPDDIISIITIEREVWIFGPKKSEVWYNAGAAPFPFQILPGNIIEQGCAAAYSPAKSDTNVYWLSQAPEGDRMIMRGNSQNVAQRISNHAIEAAFRKYARVDDAIGCTYQVQGHFFYKIHFPTVDKTWGYDEITNQWHEDNWIDTNGVLHRARNTFCTFAYGKNLGLDWATGALYEINPNIYTDAGNPIVCIRAFPHLVNDLKLTSYSAFVADVQTGSSIGTGETTQFLSPWNLGFNDGYGPLSEMEGPSIMMRMSRNGGYEYGNNRIKKLVSSGNYRTEQRWVGNGIARDAVFELAFTAEAIQALSGAYVDVLPGRS